MTATNKTGETTPKSELDTFVDESKEAIKSAQVLGYISPESVRGDLFGILNIVAEGAFDSDENEDVIALRERLYRIKDLQGKVNLPFFGIEVVTDEIGTIGLVFGD